MPPLSLRVLDLSHGVAGSFCGRLLADLGATLFRPNGPALGAAYSDLSPIAAPFAAFLAARKRDLLLNLDEASDRERLIERIGAFDAVIEDARPGTLDALGLGFDVLSAANPAIVLASITPFGQDGPYRDWLADEAVLYAMGGYQYWGGDPDRPPLMVPGHQAELQAGAQAAVAILVAARAAARDGVGQRIDQSSLEAMLSAHSWTSVAWSHTGQVLRRQGPDLVRCADGWVFFMRLAMAPSLFLLIERPELADDERFTTPQAWLANAPTLWEMVARWCATRTCDEVVGLGQELRIPVTPILDMADLHAWPQSQARASFEELPLESSGSVKAPVFPVRFSRTPVVPAVRNAEVELDRLPRRSFPASAPTHASEAALAGLRVVEVTANWAGPLAGRILGDLGAEVVKVEHARRPATRALYYAGQPMKHAYNRAGYFNKLNRNKYGVSMDLSVPKGRELFMRLIEATDVLIENNSARVMRNLGVHYEVLEAVNPRLVMASISGFGASGPARDWVAHGANIEASSGLASVTGYGAAEPRRTGGFYADPVTGVLTALAVLAALDERDRSGRGQWLDISLQESGSLFMAEAACSFAATGEAPVPHGNRHRAIAPRGAYPCFGEDMWVTVSVTTDAQWLGLCDAIDRPDLANEPALRQTEGRIAAHDRIDDAIAAWTAERDHYEAARILQAAGVPAGPVLANWELLSDLHINARDFYIPVAHPEIGVYPFPGMPWKLSRTPGGVRMPAPRFAEHNDYVYGKLLGLGADEIRALEESGVADPIPQVRMHPTQTRATR